MKLYRDVRKMVVDVMQANSSINFDGVVVSCFTRRLDMTQQMYADPNVGMGYQVTILEDILHINIPQVIKQQSKGIYPVIKTTDSPEAKLFCINEYLTLADGSIAINGYVCYNKNN